MSADTVKSASITNLDTVPALANTAGVGAPGYVQEISDYASATTGGEGSTSSTYKILRVPTTIKVKAMDVETTAALDSNGSPTFAIDVGLYYSDSTVDGTKVPLQGTEVDDNMFADNALFGAAATLKINGLKDFSVDKRNMPLWQAAGLTADPGGMFDVVVTVEATAATAVAGKIGVSMRFVA